MKTIGWVLCGLLYLFSCAAHARAPMEPVTGEPEAEVFTLDAIDGTSVRLDDYRGKFCIVELLGHMVCALPQRDAGLGPVTQETEQWRL